MLVPPVIRWAGSKRKLLPELFSASPPEFGRYFEPFVGSDCLFFALKPRRAVLGDINNELIAALRAIRNHPRLVHHQTNKLKLNRERYYRLRDQKRLPRNMIDRAARFLALNRHCFNGLYRANRNGKFNVPFGTRTGRLPSVSTFYRASVALRGATIVAGDFELTVKSARNGDFIYLDPSYVYSGLRNRGEYGPGTFSIADLDRR